MQPDSMSLLLSKVQSLDLPKINHLHYEWLKTNNLLFTLTQVKNMGLSEYSKEVMSDCFVNGSPNYSPEYYAIAPEGYYWKPDMREYHKEFKKTMRLEFYAEAICQSFTLAKKK